MRILFTHFFSDRNKGDAAILESMVQSFRMANPELVYRVITTQTLEQPSSLYLYSLFYLAYYRPGNAILKILRSLYVFNTSTLWALFVRFFRLTPDFLLSTELKRTMHAYRECDVVVPVGGGYLTGANNFHGTVTVFIHLHAIWIALLLDKKIYLYSQSIGPFGNVWQRLASQVILSRCDKIFVREDFSIETLQLLDLNDTLFVRSVDSAFALQSEKQVEMKAFLILLGVDFRSKLVGITLKNFLTQKKQFTYEREVAQFISYLQDCGDYSIIIIPQVTSSEHNDDDRIVGRRVFSLLNSKKGVFLLDEDISLFRLKGIYENLNFLVGTRMHSCIFSLTAQVPVLAIEYEYKTRGVMKDLGLSDFVIQMESVTFETLKAKFAYLIQRQADYKLRLQSVMPNYIARARKPATEIVKMVEQVP